MKLISWNVNGLRACLGKGFLDFCAASDADAICLQETKMKPEQAEFELTGYEKYWNSADKAGYSGTAVFTKIKPLGVTYGFGEDIQNALIRLFRLCFVCRLYPFRWNFVFFRRYWDFFSIVLGGSNFFLYVFFIFDH